MRKLFLFFLALSYCSFGYSQTGFGNTEISEEALAAAKKKIEMIRNEIISGKMDFAKAAIKYSQDPGSASKGGLYKNVKRGTFVKEFDAVAFASKEKEVSKVFRTRFGYHILMVESKRGNEMDVRHILIKP
ncbi:MAG TPA: peptidylprolyl isomerase [Bacteroidia bacterium]